MSSPPDMSSPDTSAWARPALADTDAEAILVVSSELDPDLEADADANRITKGAGPRQTPLSLSLRPNH
ncbi:hypothetical protein R8Z50_22085 [Longispora sp. K20-0274]|uniref:hypothetical protein n=1 Tax=Longispora sp. K20-0274 TaxID=3088255 RepID=UPI00399B1D3B